MATITEKTKGNKVISFKFHCYVGRDEQGKQHFRTTTWKPPEGLSYAKARKMAEAESYRWEQTIKGNAEGQGVYTSPLPAPCEAVQTAEEVPEEETFRYFAEQVWMPLKVIAGGDFSRTKLDYISLDAMDIFAQIEAGNGASGSNSVDGL